MEDQAGWRIPYYDRHVDRRNPARRREPERAGFLVPLDIFGILAPVWLVLAAVAVATPLVAVFDGLNSSYHWDIAIGFYGLIFAVWLMIPWSASYLLWRVVGLATGSTIAFVAGMVGIVASVLLVTLGALAWPALAIATFSLCG